MLNVVRKFELEIKPVNWLGFHRQYLVDGEMEVLVALARSVDAKVMIEFGCRDGRTAGVLLYNVPTLERYIGVDVPLSYKPAFQHQVNEMVIVPGYYVKKDPLFELVIRNKGTLDLKPEDLPVCDIVFIDGDHSEKVVRHDSYLARSILRSGGLIVWHDYHNNTVVDVKLVVDSLAADGWPICQISNTWLAFCKI